MTWDWGIFKALNFDGGETIDAAMETVSGTAMWIPLYLLIFYLVWRRDSWRGLLLFVLLLAAAMGLADIIAGIFKHSGVLKDLWPSFPARPRPMFTEELGAIHVPSFEHGPYGTVSSHASTVVALAVMSVAIVKRRWFAYTMIAVTLLVCYSRIYLACHFPCDLLLGSAVGALSGWLCAWLYCRALRFCTTCRRKKESGKEL
ncbi:MAG: phosphatase PAP2 family protein [Alistipes sp.]|nr:phosphatase PAP2 family protein [Alistipes sp.]MDE6862225.1 phosphatase PAP2 family protein [Alistipes sp.]